MALGLAVLGPGMGCGAPKRLPADPGTGGSYGEGGSATGGSATGGATGGGSATGGAADGGPTGECVRTGPCPQTCAVSIFAWLEVTGSNNQASSSLNGVGSTMNMQAQVTTVSTGPWSATLNYASVSPRPTERMLLQLRDAHGVSWDLSLPVDLISADRFPVGTPLTVMFQRQPVNILGANWLLTVSDAGGLALFVIDAREPESIALPQSGLTFSTGAMTCPYAIPGSDGCSSARFATMVSAGDARQAAPCRAPVGGFLVTASYQKDGQAPPSCNGVRGSCDSASSFQASGVRQP